MIYSTIHHLLFLRYNGELIQQGLKAVPAVVRPADYDYGSVNNDAIPVLATFLLLSVAIAALVTTAISDLKHLFQNDFNLGAYILMTVMISTYAGSLRTVNR